jgi:hypothetical protein
MKKLLIIFILTSCATVKKSNDHVPRFDRTQQHLKK